MKIIAITQARVGSKRLPGKVLKKIGEVTMLQVHIERALTSKLIDKLIVATTFEDDADAICSIAENLNITCFRGSTDDVLERYHQAALPHNPDFVVRITSDCPLNDGMLIDELIESALKENCDFYSNTLQPTYPDGLDIEIMKFSALEKAVKEATSQSDREHVTPYIWRNSTFKGGTLFTSKNHYAPKDLSSYRLTVDEPTDFQLISLLIDKLGYHEEWTRYVNYLDLNPELTSINALVKPNKRQ